MNSKEKIFVEQIYAVRDFLFHYSSYRILLQNFSDLSQKGSIEFCVFTINAHYFQAINLWCMVFGANNNEIHWKKLGLNKELGPSIIDEISITQAQYNSYWREVVDWRNKYSAHRVPSFLYSTDIPDLKIARSVIFIYEKWLSEHMDISLEFTYEKYESDFIKEVKNTINTFLSD